MLAHYSENLGDLLVGRQAAYVDNQEDILELIELYKSDLINHVRVRLESAVCYNHEIFKGMHQLPRCLVYEIMHEKTV